MEFRAPINLVVAAGIGLVGLRRWPAPIDNVFLAVVDARKPWLVEGVRGEFQNAEDTSGSTCTPSAGRAAWRWLCVRYRGR